MKAIRLLGHRSGCYFCQSCSTRHHIFSCNIVDPYDAPRRQEVIAVPLFVKITTPHPKDDSKTSVCSSQNDLSPVQLLQEPGRASPCKSSVAWTESNVAREGGEKRERPMRKRLVTAQQKQGGVEATTPFAFVSPFVSPKEKKGIRRCFNHTQPQINPKRDAGFVLCSAGFSWSRS